jgi:hypothetical protein
LLRTRSEVDIELAIERPFRKRLDSQGTRRPFREGGIEARNDARHRGALRGQPGNEKIAVLLRIKPVSVFADACTLDALPGKTIMLLQYAALNLVR